MYQRMLFAACLALVTSNGANACLALGECEGKTRERPLTAAEISSVLNFLAKRISNAHLFEQYSGLISCKAEPSYLFVGFESERIRESATFCRAVTGGLRGELTAAGDIAWDDTGQQTLYSLYRVSANERCADADESDHVYVNAATDIKTVSWVLENAANIWSRFVGIASRGNLDRVDGNAVMPTLFSIMVHGEDRLDVTFSDTSGVNFRANLHLVDERWIVQEAFVIAP
ncbi:MAG TPA: hypothetical protein VFV64_14825 [Permianibacter sp.]|nr:hypothetical protein [Permianibacter sp.]